MSSIGHLIRGNLSYIPLISFQGGFICSLGSGRAVVVDTVISKESDEDIKITVSQIIKLPLRNANTAGTWTSAQTASGKK